MLVARKDENRFSTKLVNGYNRVLQCTNSCEGNRCTMGDKRREMEWVDSVASG